MFNSSQFGGGRHRGVGRKFNLACVGFEIPKDIQVKLSGTQLEIRSLYCK